MFAFDSSNSMEIITIEGKTGLSKIYIGERLARVDTYLPAKGVFIITDRNVNDLYGMGFPDFPVFVAEPGEASKDFSVMTTIYHWLLENGADRSSFILGIGGGVVCDLAGFVASTFMRGIRFGFVASTLLAQVDASVGGKNGVNLGGYKNIVGTFTQPEFVICDTQMLTTLSPDEFRNGMAEVIKHALIRDKEKFYFLQKEQEALLNRQTDAVNHIVSRSVKIKAAIVQADEREQGQRRLLNFGHTWGHAIEKVEGIAHGKAVSLGMAFASSLSVKKGCFTTSDHHQAIALLQDYGLPVQMSLDKEKVFEVMLKDKKKEQNIMHFVLLDAIGSAFVHPWDVNDLKELVFNDSPL